MKKSLNYFFLFNLMVLCLFSGTKAFSDVPTYSLDVRNEAFVSSKVFEFDLYLTSTGATQLELACINSGILLNAGFVNNGTITPTLVAGSELNISQVPSSIAYDAATNCIKIAPVAPPRNYTTGISSGTIISSTTGTKYCRVRLTNSLDFGVDPANYAWNMNLTPYRTVVSAFVPGATPLVNTVVTSASSQSISNNLTLYIEGLYQTGTGNRKAQDELGNHFPGPVADVVTVKLAQATTPYSDVFTANNVLLYTNGKCSFQVPGSLSGSYYIVVKHRNSIETWSATPVAFSSSNLSYDFSTSATQAFGNNMKLMGSVYAIWGGDATQDGIVDGSDMSVVYNASQPPVLSGYNFQDVNGDGIVDGSDMSLIYNNSQPPVVTTVKP